MTWMYAIISFIAGVFLSMQGSLNSQVERHFSMPSMIFALSLLQAMLAMFFLLPDLKSGFHPMSKPQIWIAAVLGVCIVFGIALSIPKMGAMPTFMMIIFGQLLLSTLVDHFGLFGVEAKQISVQRWISLTCMMLAAGLLITERH